MKLELIQVDGKKIDLLDCENPNMVLDHFNNPSSQAYAILNIINQGFYNVFDYSFRDVVVDVGANIGLFSLFVQPVSKNVHAFEPDPSHFSILEILCKCFPNIFLNNCAIALETGEQKFYVDSVNSTSNNLIECSNPHETISVKTLALEEINDDIGDIDFLKMDIEGYENIISNSFDFSKFPHVKQMYLEVHGDYKNFDSLRNRWIEKLNSLDYKCSKINSDGILAERSIDVWH